LHGDLQVHNEANGKSHEGAVSAATDWVRSQKSCQINRINRVDNKLGRREFLRRATQAAAAGVVSTGIASGAVPKEKKIDLADTIPTRALGKTGVKLPILGYGSAGLDFLQRV
jgi:hypothetical protein